MEREKMIQAYLDGSMSAGEKLKFEKEISENTELARAVELSKEIDEAIAEDDIILLRKKIRDLLDKEETVPASKYHRFMRLVKVPMAASIVLLIGLSLWKILAPSSSQEIFETFYQPYLNDVTTRAMQQDQEKIQLAYLLYQEGDFEPSFQILQNYLEKNYNNLTAQFYFALNAIELDQNSKAIDALVPVANDPFTPYSLHAKWYLALTYLEENQPEQARIFLQELSSKENMYSDRANKILKKIRS